MKVRILNPTRFYYPDVTICEEPRFADDCRDALLNPLIVFEVLSGWPKFRAYQTIESLQEYVLVSQDAYSVEHYRRNGNQWIFTPAEGREAHLILPAVECDAPLAEIYRQVDIS